jgi:hypothetical protein
MFSLFVVICLLLCYCYICHFHAEQDKCKKAYADAEAKEMEERWVRAIYEEQCESKQRRMFREFRELRDSRAAEQGPPPLPDRRAAILAQKARKAKLAA